MPDTLNNILAIEDDTGLARLLQKRLERAGFHIDLAYNGEEGLALLEKNTYDLVLLDYILPGMSGLDVLTRMEALPRMVPTIILTAGGDERVALKALNKGAVDYVVKDANQTYLDLLPEVMQAAFTRAMPPNNLTEITEEERAKLRAWGAPARRAEDARAGESLVRAGDKSLIEDFAKLGSDQDPNVVLQAIMTAKVLGSNEVKAWPDFAKFQQKTLLATSSKGVKELGAMVLTGTDQVGGREYTGEENKLLVKGQTIYRELCFACHGYDGKGMAIDGPKPGMTIAPPFGNSATVKGHRDGIVRVLLAGMSGPIGGKTYDAQMVPMAMNDDECIAAVASYVRNSFGNKGAVIFPPDVARIRLEMKEVTAPWTQETLQASLPPIVKAAKDWKVSASDQADTAQNGCDADGKTRWETKSEQKKGMWYQVELPATQTVAGVRLDATGRPSAFPKNFKVEGSVDGKKWFPLGTSHGLYALSEAYFGAKQAKFVKVTLTDATKGQPWAIQELQLIAQK